MLVHHAQRRSRLADEAGWAAHLSRSKWSGIKVVDPGPRLRLRRAAPTLGRPVAPGSDLAGLVADQDPPKR